MTFHQHHYKTALFITLFVCNFIANGVGDKLESMADADLDKLINQEAYVIVLFTSKDGGDKSEDFESELATVREDLVDSLNAWVVKAVDSKLKDNFAPDQSGPVVVFFRKQNPVIYDGPANEEEILETISAFKEPCIKSLNDNTFEHLTQAGTGATTGDWFVFFRRDDCEECDRLRARIETVACKLRGRANVAVVDRAGSGQVTGRRFGVTKVPEIIFFRLGKMYRYSIEKFDIASMMSFISGWYKNVPAEPVPAPKTPFDDLVQLCVDYIRENPVVSAAIVGCPVFILILFYFLTREEDSRPKKSKKKKKDKSS